MAKIRSFNMGKQDVRPHSTEVDCFHQIVTDTDGTQLLHLSTFGSDDRTSAPKSSQSIQLDEQAAYELVRVIRSAFPSI